jgi:outer membrane lipoprotein-sorting protein/anti-sigma factor RsiW
MRTLTLWVRTASTARLVAVGAAIAVVFVAANAFAALDTGGAKPPPPATLAELTLSELGSSGPEGISANFRYVNSLVPTTSLIPQASAGGSSLPLVTGADGRLWYSGGRLRLEFQTRQGDTQLVVHGTHALMYDASDGTAFAATLPSIATLGGLRTGLAGATQLLGRLRSSLHISQPVPGVTAGRPSYTVQLAPVERSGLLTRVSLAVDADTGTPLRLEVYGRGQQKPLVEFALSNIRYGPVDPSVFKLQLPFGMQPVPVRFGSPPSLGATVDCTAPAQLGGLPLQSCREASRADELPGRLLVYGHSFGSVVVLEQPGGGDPGGGLWGLLPSVSVSGADGRELVTPLGTVIRFARGGITYTVVGSLPRPVVEAVARGL